MRFLSAITLPAFLGAFITPAIAAPSTTPCSTTNDLVFKDGDFECGLFPWRALATNGTTYWISADHPYAGKGAFEVYQAGALTDNVGLGQATLEQVFYLTQGKSYKMGFYTYQTAAAGMLGIKINGQAIRTVAPGDQGGIGKWVYNEASWTASTGQQLLTFEFFTGQGSVQRIDSITITATS